MVALGSKRALRRKLKSIRARSGGGTHLSFRMWEAKTEELKQVLGFMNIRFYWESWWNLKQNPKTLASSYGASRR